MPDWGEDSFPFIFAWLPMWEQFVVPLDGRAGIWSHISPWILVYSKFPFKLERFPWVKKLRIRSVAFGGRNAGSCRLELCFWQVKRLCFVSKTTFIIVLHKNSPSLVRLKIKGILYSVKEERNLAIRLEEEREVNFINFVFMVRPWKN